MPMSPIWLLLLWFSKLNLILNSHIHVVRHAQSIFVKYSQPMRIDEEENMK